MGRSSKFNSELTAKVAALYGAGKTDKEVAEIIGVSLRTIHYWKSSQPDFLHSLKEGKDVADELVTSSLFRRATGYSHPEEKIFCNEGRIVRAKTVKHYPPDVTAAIFWLKNRRPGEWRENSHILVDTTNSNTCASKKSYPEFCETAGYPKPFEKQIEMMDFVINGGPKESKLPRLLLGARKYGKTDYCTLLGLAYKIYLDPTFTSLLVTKVEKNGRRFLREISRCLEANGVTLAVDNSNEIKAEGQPGKDSSVMLLTIGSSGFRSLHPDLIIFDDPVVPGAVSEADREQVMNVYSEAMKLSKNIALIGQPVDFRDLYQHLRSIIDTMEMPYGSIPELDDDLDVIRASGVDEKSIQASYFLKVDPEGDATFHDINRINGFPDADSIAFMDPSEGGDYTALGIFTGHMNGMAIIGFAWKKAWHLCIPEMVKIFEKYKVRKMGFETNMFGVLPLQVLRENLHKINVSVEGKYTHSNKEARIQLAAQFSKNLYLSNDSNHEYKRQVVEYSHDAKFDDSPDTIATFLEWAGKIRPPKAIKKPSKDL